MALADYYRRRARGVRIPGVDTDHWGTRAVDERGRPRLILPAEPVYTRPRRTMEARVGEGEGLPLASGIPYEPPPLLPSEPVSMAPVTYTRPRTVEEPVDPLTKIAETREYHASQKPVNDDPWWKNMLKGLGRGALYGAASGQGLAGMLGGAATGGVMGLASPAMDDRMENQAEVAKLDEQYKREYGRQKAVADLDTQTSTNYYRRAQAKKLAGEPEQKRQEAADKALEAERDNILKTVGDLQEFDPDAQDAHTQALVTRAKTLGLTLLKKKPADNFATAVAPDGSIITTNTRTGRFNVDRSSNVARPREVSAKDILPAVHAALGIRGDDEIKDIARAGVSKIRQKTRSVDVNPALLREGSPYRNSDGTPNESAIWKAINEEVLTLRDAFPAVSDTEANDFEREAATQRQRLRGAQGEKQRAAERYAAIIEEISRKPNPQATREVNLNDLNRALRAVMENPNPKERARDLEGFFRDLYSVRIR